MNSKWMWTMVACYALLMMTACGSKSQDVQAASGNPQGPAPAVTVAVAGQQQIPLQIAAIGNAQAYRSVQIKSMVDGQIDKVLLTQGEDVRAGQELFELDKRPFQAALAQAQA